MEKTIRFPDYFPVSCHTDRVGPGSTFVVIHGMKDDGLLHISTALQKGASKIVIGEDVVLDPALMAQIKAAGARIERAADTRLALAEQSAQALNYPASRLNIIGITGTKGKTTTAFLTEHILKTAGGKTALISTVENHILSQTFQAPLTTPQPDYIHVFLDLCVQAGVEWVVMETSAQALTLHRINGILLDVALFTNFSQEHAEFYATNDDYFAAKRSIIEHLKPHSALLLNACDSRVAALASLHENTFLFDSMGTHAADLEARLELLTVAGITAGLNFYFTEDSCGEGCDCAGDFDEDVCQESAACNAIDCDEAISDENVCQESYTITAPALMGDFNLANIAAAALCAHVLSIDSTVIADAIQTFGGVPGRLARYDLPNGATAFIDYAHTPSSFEAVLGTLRQLTDRLIVVFGAGGERDPIKRPQMGAVAARTADTVVLTSDNPRSEDPREIIKAINAGIDQNLLHKIVIEVDREQAIKSAYAASGPGSIIALLGKGPDEYQLIAGVKTHFSEREILEKVGRESL